MGVSVITVPKVTWLCTEFKAWVNSCKISPQCIAWLRSICYAIGILSVICCVNGPMNIHDWLISNRKIVGKA